MRPYLPTDMDAIVKWYDLRGVTAPDEHMFPTIGLFEPDVAAGFLIRTDTSTAILEGFITNPSSDKEKRSEALNTIIAGLKTVASHLGYSQVIGFTELDVIIDRVKEHDFAVGSKYNILIAKTPQAVFSTLVGQA